MRRSTPSRQSRRRRRPKPETFKWPIYGYSARRDRFLDANISPPFKVEWRFAKGHGLIEFQPVLANRVLYYVNNGGNAFAVDAKTGKMKWRQKVASLNASSPAWNAGRIFIATLSPGSIVALNAKNGHRILEEAPAQPRRVVADRRERDRVLRLGGRHRVCLPRERRPQGLDLPRRRRREGRPRLPQRQRSTSATTRAPSRPCARATARRSGAPARAARASAGRASSTRRPRSPSAASTWGTPTASSTRSSRRTGTSHGGTARATTCTRRPPSAMSLGLGPTVFIGSYDGNFYALDARSGSVRWTHHDGGRISGRADGRRQVRLLLEPRPQGHPGPGRAQRPAQVEVPARRVQPGDLRRQARLPHHAARTVLGLVPTQAKKPAAKPRPKAKKKKH